MTALKFTTADVVTGIILGIAIGMMLYHLALNIREIIELNRKEKEDKIKNENRDPVDLRFDTIEKQIKLLEQNIDDITIFILKHFTENK